MSALAELFDNFMQQDAHEFLNYLLNAISETLSDERTKEQSNGSARANGPSAATSRKANAHASTAEASMCVMACKSLARARAPRKYAPLMACSLQAI